MPRTTRAARHPATPARAIAPVRVQCGCPHEGSSDAGLTPRIPGRALPGPLDERWEPPVGKNKVLLLWLLLLLLLLLLVLIRFSILWFPLGS